MSSIKGVDNDTMGWKESKCHKLPINFYDSLVQEKESLFHSHSVEFLGSNEGGIFFIRIKMEKTFNDESTEKEGKDTAK